MRTNLSEFTHYKIAYPSKTGYDFCVFWSAFSALVRLLSAWLEPAARQPNPIYEIEILKLLHMGRTAVRPF
jgi:hypothetical protein